MKHKHNRTWRPRKLNELGFVCRGESRHRPRNAPELAYGKALKADDDFNPIDTVFFVDTKVSPHYVYYHLSLSQSFLNSDAAVLGLNRNQAYRNPFVLPSHDVPSPFEDQCSTLFSALRNLRKGNGNLRITRDLLLHKLINGHLEAAA